MKPRRKLVFLARCLLLLSCLQETMSDDTEEKLKYELEMDDLELVDVCEQIGTAKMTAYLEENFKDKVTQEESYGTMIRTHYEVLKEFQYVPTEFGRNHTLQVKPGDGLLPQDRWNQLVSYKNRIERISNDRILQHLNASDISLDANGDSQGIPNVSRVIENHISTWNEWGEVYNVSDIEAFPDHLQAVKEAAKLNGFESVEEYWEMLCDFPGAYAKSKDMWEEISPFYNRLLGFVKKRVFKYYKLNTSQELDEIPAYLLGYPLASDWSNIADLILPHPQLHYDVESYLKYKDIKDIYEYSENVVRNLGLGSLGTKFWQSSDFNASVCGPKVLEFCDSEYTGILECNRPSWQTYLNSHEASVKIALNNVDYRGLTRQHLRFSAVDDAIETLGSLIAINSLEYHGILDESIYDNETQSVTMTKLLLTALRIMPRLSYYVMADKWRLEAMEQNDTNVAERYWIYRKEYNGVRGDTNQEPEYLEDLHILENKPYISKFFGTLIAFQLFEYYKERSESSTNIQFGNDDTFMAMIRERSTTDWPDLLNLHYGLEVDSRELLTYFEPLEEYFKNAPEEQVAIVTTTTTTTTSTTTTTTSTTTPKPTTIWTKDVERGSNRMASAVLSDQPTLNVTSVNSGSAPIQDSHVAMWVGVLLLILVACLLLAGYGYKVLRKKRRTNNRRFDT